jgi:8-oxo-dGTP diphosphatase
LISNILRVTHKLDVATKVVGENRAAVVLILHDSEELDALFVKRKTSPADPWSGQIALPGGRFEPEDASLIDTAMREVIEEVGIDLRAQGRLLGTLDDA